MLLESTSINSAIGINDGSESKIGRQHEDGDAADWDRRSIAIRAPPDPSPATRSIHICCASWRLRD